MKRTLVALATAIAAVAVAVAPVAAITKNFQPDPNHTFVGLVAFYDSNWEFQHRCTGELIAPTVLLTAGHCTDNEHQGVNAHARVWFEQNAGAQFNGVEDPVTGYPNQCKDPTMCVESSVMYNYGFDNFAGFPNTHDVGIVILDKPMTNLGFASLAGAGTLNPLIKAPGTQDTNFRVSGYGISYAQIRGINPDKTKVILTVSYRVRLQAVESLVNLTAPYNAGYNIQLNGNGDDRGGTCSGDSGGPVFWPQNSNQIVAVTSFGKNATCRGDGYYYRTDRQAVIDWILSKAGNDAANITVN
jgi:hypothetical protein